MKNSLRQKYKQIRKNVAEPTEKSRQIAENICTDEIWQQAQIVALYLSFGSEVQTQEIVKKAWQQNKLVVVPITDNQSCEMNFCQLKEDTATVATALGMHEPILDAEKIIAPEQIDICILPGVAFDKKGHRLGMGKGCYDRYLPKLRKDVLKIALAFEDQLADEDLPYDKFDVKMDYIITEKEIILCR